MAINIGYRNLSLRYKIPLRVLVLVVTTVVVVTAAMIAREAEELRTTLLASAESMGRMLAETVVAPIKHDDVWRTFELINTPFRATRQGALEQQAEMILVLDAQQRVFVSTDPQRFPVLGDPAHGREHYRSVIAEIAHAPSGRTPWSLEDASSGRIHMVVPVTSDEVLLGHVVLTYSKSVFMAHYIELARRGALVGLLTLALLLPAGWFWAHRVAKPLLQLSHAMAQVKRLPQSDSLELYESDDEIGQLGTALRRMLEELREKALLEREVVVSDRLAALGRLAAGIAHEINNPLGGMLNAINTFERHGPRDPMTRKTLSMLERGLTQIKNTVAALLVEAKIASHALSREDIDDTHTLVLAEAEKKQADFDWRNEVDRSVPLPSTLVRQVMLNLLLNAVHAIDPGGSLKCRTRIEGETLRIDVANDGRYIPEERLPYLFEPFSHTGEAGAGTGLGLWVTYQIVQQLGGGLNVTSAPGATTFSVEFPLGQAA